MNDDVRNLLEEEIITEIKALSSIQSGSKEKSEAIDDLVQLYKLRIEETKLEDERGFKSEQSICEKKLKAAQFREQVLDRYYKTAIEAAGIVLPLIFYAVWMRKGFKFEEDGTFTSTTFRGLFSRFKPTK